MQRRAFMRARLYQSDNLSRISITNRSAVFLPIPGKRTKLAVSLFKTQRTNSSGEILDKMVNAKRGPRHSLLVTYEINDVHRVL